MLLTCPLCYVGGILAEEPATLKSGYDALNV